LRNNSRMSFGSPKRKWTKWKRRCDPIYMRGCVRKLQNRLKTIVREDSQQINITAFWRIKHTLESSTPWTLRDALWKQKAVTHDYFELATTSRKRWNSIPRKCAIAKGVQCSVTDTPDTHLFKNKNNKRHFALTRNSLHTNHREISDQEGEKKNYIKTQNCVQIPAPRARKSLGAVHVKIMSWISNL